MGSETITYKDLQVEPIMSHPEKAYKQYQLEAFKQIRNGMRHVNATYQTGIIDTRSLFNDGFLNALGYNSSEKIKYTVFDPALVLSWLRTNISPSIESNVSAQWRAPTLEELALEYLQDTYSGMILAEKSFLIDGVRWFISGVTSTSSTTTDATCYKNKYDTVTKSISPSNIVYIENQMVVYDGVNCWAVKVTTSAELKYIPVEYTTIQCPGISDGAVQASIAMYDNSVQSVQYISEPDTEYGTTSGWTATVRMSVYIDDSGEIEITGTIVSFSSHGYFSTWQVADARRAAEAAAVEKVKQLVDEETNDRIERLVAYYVLNGESKIVIAEIDKTVVASTANAKAFPIIPLKENFGFVNEARGMKVILNKIGMASKDFKDSLADTHVKNAALMFILNIRDDNPAVVKAVFETAVTMVETAASGAAKSAGRMPYSLNLSYSQVNMITGFNFTLETISGSIGPVGTYKKYPNGIRKQISETYYKELVFLSSQTDWYVGGYVLKRKRSIKNMAIESASIMDNSYEGTAVNRVYIPVTDIGLKTLNYRELHYVLARSMSMMVLSITVVKSKWYQSMFFQAIMFVVIVVIIYFTGGILMGLLAFLGMTGVDLGVFGQILTVVMAIYTMGTSLAASGFTLTTGTLLTSAQTLTSLAVVASDITTKGAMKALEDKSNETQAALNESEKLIEEINENTSPGLWMGIDDRLPDMLYLMSSTDVMCNNDLLYDYDSVIDGQIRSVGV